MLKGNQTLVATPAGNVFINPTGNDAMATGGMGDVLAGIIGGFIAQGTKPLESAMLGVYIHGLAGDIWVSENGSVGCLASDVIHYLPKAIKAISG